MKQYSSTNGVWLKPDADYSNVPGTFEFVERDEGTSPSQLIIKAHGCMGNAKLVCDEVGKPMRIDFDFKGVLTSITDRAYASILTPTGWDTPQPEAILGATTTIFAENMKFGKVAFDLGNDVQGWTDPSKAQGLEGYRIADRNPSLEIDPDMYLVATSGMEARQRLNTTGALALYAGNHILISAPAAQIVDSYKPGEREGHVTYTLMF
jgi:hypothetical protein